MHEDGVRALLLGVYLPPSQGKPLGMIYFYFILRRPEHCLWVYTGAPPIAIMKQPTTAQYYYLRGNMQLASGLLHVFKYIPIILTNKLENFITKADQQVTYIGKLKKYHSNAQGNYVDQLLPLLHWQHSLSLLLFHWAS